MNENNLLHKKYGLLSRLMLLVLFFCIGAFITIAITSVLTYAKVNFRTLTVISITIQNLFAMVLPAAMVAVFISKKPLDFLGANKLPSLKAIIFAIALYAIFTPAMEWIVRWNQTLTLPDSMSAIYDAIKQLEAQAEDMTSKILINQSLLAMIVNVMALGILTGVGEEFIFRGTLQRILQLKPMNPHIAIFITAFMFSALHFQFFGFVPRFILGIFFGYLMYYTSSVWTSAILHAINNSSVVIVAYFCGYEATQSTDINNTAAIVSAISTIAAVIIFFVYKKRTNANG